MKIFFFAILTTLFVVSFGQDKQGYVSVPVSAGKSAAKEEPARETETYFGPKRSDWERMRAMFSGADPYAVIADPEMKEDLKKTVRLMLDPAAEERKIAVAAYMSRMKRKNIGFVYENLDGVLNAYYGRETKVDEAFYDIARMLHPHESFFYEEYGPLILCISVWISSLTAFGLLLWFLIKRRKTIKNWIVQKMKTTSPFLLCSLILTELLLAVAVVAAFLPGGTKLDNGFYTFLRIAVCGTSAWLAWINRTGRPVLCFFLAAFAALFNPLIPIHFGDRDVWSIFDLAAIPLLLCSTFLTKKDSR